MFNFLSSNIVNSITNIFITKKERHIILDPFCSLVKLSLLKYLEPGTKISIYDNKIYFNEPSNIQGVIRFIYGDGREDLHNLYQPIKKCAKWYWNETNKEMCYLFHNAVDGIKKLKSSYTSWATIQHTLDYYILLLIQNDKHFFKKYITNSDTKIINKAMDNYDSSDTETEEAVSESVIRSADKVSDIHKYLKELWSEREINIIINLFHELDNKKDDNEIKNIKDNIIQYCAMKENKLNKYIEENSKFLT